MPAAAAARSPRSPRPSAYSRVHTGVHWPSDVAAGAAIGVGVAPLTRRWWPCGREEPRARRRHASPALVDGEGLVVVVNPGSGPADDDPSERRSRGAAPRRGPHRATGPDRRTAGRRVADAATEPARWAWRAATAPWRRSRRVAAEHDLPLVLVPAGTLNHFARDVGV